MKEIELLKIIFKDSPDILEPLNEIDKEIERLKNKIHEVSEIQNELYNERTDLKNKNNNLNNIKKEIREYINNFNVFEKFSFPLMKRWEESQVKSSIDYEFKITLKKDLLEILDKENKV